MIQASRRFFALTCLLAVIVWCLSASASGQGLEPPPNLYAVRLAASGRDERASIASLGFAIDAVDEQSVTITVSETGLQRLRGQDLQLVDIRPLQTCIDDEDYHSFDEMVAELTQAAIDHPDIVQVSTIGQSIEGRPVYAVKVSDHVSLDEDEPEVLLFALSHAREHLTTEQALDLVAHFSDSYGLRGDVTNLVNQRQIWILPNVNPDGDAWDRLGGGCYQGWRKNRRDNGDGSWGVDLNRNYGYKWGYDNLGSSPLTGQETYRGTSPFSEPETQVIRDFVLSHPGIASSISFHTYGELVLWPYGYTYEDAPADMDPADHSAFVEMGRNMARLNGYTAKQSSDLYPTNGASDDWLYGEHGIFAFTFELFPVSAYPGFYPDDDVIPTQTARNRDAVAYLIGVSDNPKKVAGLGGDTTRPTVQITDPSAGEQLRGVVELQAVAYDDVGVTLVEFKIGDVTVGLDTEAPFVIAWDSSSRPGVDWLSADAYDHGHNVGHSMPILVTVLAPEPTATVTPTPMATPTATTVPTAEPTPTATVQPTGSWTVGLPLITSDSPL